jgi:hypothetical protein
MQTRLQGGYGNGEGNPAGEHPQQQGKNPSESLEHPGPPPPKVAQGKSPSPDEESSSSKSSQSESQSKAQSKSNGDKNGEKASEGNKGSKGAPQPKILSENPPLEQSEGVKQHNDEMKDRAERAYEQVSNEDAKKDKVSKGYWSGKSQNFNRLVARWIDAN